MSAGGRAGLNSPSAPTARRTPSARAGGSPVAAWHPHRAAGADALEAAEIADQQLAAPDRAVGAVAGAVEDRADRRAGLAVLGQSRGQVRVVMLHADQLDALALERVLGRQVVRVQVVGDDLRLDREEPLEVLDPLA